MELKPAKGWPYRALPIRMYRGVVLGVAHIIDGLFLIVTIGVYYINLDYILIFSWARGDAINEIKRRKS